MSVRLSFADRNHAQNVSSHLVISFRFLRKTKSIPMWENYAKYIHIQLTHECKKTKQHNSKEC